MGKSGRKSRTDLLNCFFEIGLDFFQFSLFPSTCTANNRKGTGKETYKWISAELGGLKSVRALLVRGFEELLGGLGKESSRISR